MQHSGPKLLKNNTPALPASLNLNGMRIACPAGMKKYLAELDQIYEADPLGQWSGHRAAMIVGEVSQLMAAAGHAELVRAPVDDADVIDAKRYVSAAIAATTPPPTVLTPPEIAKQLGADPATVLGWIRSGQLKASNLATGHRPRFVVQPFDLDAFLKARQLGQRKRS